MLVLRLGWPTVWPWQSRNWPFCQGEKMKNMVMSRKIARKIWLSRNKNKWSSKLSRNLILIFKEFWAESWLPYLRLLTSVLNRTIAFNTRQSYKREWHITNAGQESQEPMCTKRADMRRIVESCAHLETFSLTRNLAFEVWNFTMINMTICTSIPTESTILITNLMFIFM